MQQVLIRHGFYRNFEIKDQVFDVVKDFKEGKRGGFITVRSDGFFGAEHDVVRIRVGTTENIEVGKFEKPANTQTEDCQPDESDEEVMRRIEERFDILDRMTGATIDGHIRAMIVTGPPGVGKSYGIEKQLEKAGLFDTIKNKKQKYHFVKGATTPVGLYCTLFENSEENTVLVFDDCDSVLLDDLSLNLLKAALDTGKTRRIHWNADSSKLKNEDVPNSFEFRGSVIFVTNLKFDNIRSKRLADHLEALQSRCHYLDLTMDTMRDRILRIRQIFLKGELFKDYNFSHETGESIINFMEKNKDYLREVSLRMAIKIADLTKITDDWRSLARTTCMRK